MSYLNLYEEHSLFFMFLAALAEEILLASYAREEREFTEAASVPHDR